MKTVMGGTTTLAVRVFIFMSNTANPKPTIAVAIVPAVKFQAYCTHVMGGRENWRGHRRHTEDIKCLW